MEQVILVNEQDIELGVMEKMEAHEKALLHRAFSVFILMTVMNCYYNKELLVNTIVVDSGPTLVVVTRVRVKLLLMPLYAG